MSALLALILFIGGPPAFAQTAAPVEKPKMGIKVATPHGPRLLVGFSALGPIADLETIKARMAELRCPPVLIQGAGDSAKIIAMFSERCDQEAAVAYMGEILKNKYPGLRDTDVIILPVADTDN